MPTVNIALELHGAKQNLAFAFPDGVPVLATLKDVVSRTFEHEAVRMAQGHEVHPPAVFVEDMELYDPATQTWLQVDAATRIPDGAQLYAFQPHTVDDQGRIPPARPAPYVPYVAPGPATREGSMHNTPQLHMAPPPRQAAAVAAAAPAVVPQSYPAVGGVPDVAQGNSFAMQQQPSLAGAASRGPSPMPFAAPERGDAAFSDTAAAAAAPTRMSPAALPAQQPLPSEVGAGVAAAAAAASAAAARAVGMHSSTHVPAPAEAAAGRATPTEHAAAGAWAAAPAAPTMPYGYQPAQHAPTHMDPRHHMQPPQRPQRVVVVVGVGPGSLGEACARWLAQHALSVASPYEYVVVASGRQEVHLKRLKTEMRHVHFYAVDCTDPEGLEEFADIVCRMHGRPNLVINAVGASAPPSGFFDGPRCAFDEQVDVLVKGTANICRTFLGVMGASAEHAIRDKNYEGVLVNMSSNWGRTAVAGHSALCASKWAVEGLSKSIALELPPQLACIPVNPGVAVTRGLVTLLGPDAANKATSVQHWAEQAMPFLLALSPKDNGRSLTCPGAPQHHFDNAMQTAKPIWALGFN